MGNYLVPMGSTATEINSEGARDLSYLHACYYEPTLDRQTKTAILDFGYLYLCIISHFTRAGLRFSKGATSLIAQHVQV